MKSKTTVGLAVVVAAIKNPLPWLGMASVGLLVQVGLAGCASSTDDGPESGGNAFSSSASPASSAKQSVGTPNIAPGTSYTTARQMLVQQGWAPFRADDAGACPDGDTRCTGRPETEFCAPTGDAACSFLWKKDATTIQVDTVGEGDPGVSSVKVDSRSLQGTVAVLPSVPAGTDYGPARTQLEQLGWLPFHAEQADTCDDGDSRCAGRPEMEFCAPTGDAACAFLWKKGTIVVRVLTVGEGEPGVDRLEFDTRELAGAVVTTTK